MRYSVFLLALAACQFTGHGRVDGGAAPSDGDDDGAPGAWLEGFAARKSITAHPAAALGEYVLSIATTDPDLATQIGNATVRVTAADGMTVLPIDIEVFDGAGALAVWVRVPDLRPDTKLWLYYDGAAPPMEPAGAWPARVKGVWHMTDATGAFTDSTIGKHDLVAIDLIRTPAKAAGLVGRARSFDGVDDNVSIADPPDGSLDFGTGSGSYSLWVNVDHSRGLYDVVIYKGGGVASDRGYDLELGTSGWNAYIADSQDQSQVRLGDDTNFFGRWVHLAIVIDRAANLLRTYADGLPLGTADITAIDDLDGGFNFRFGLPGYEYVGLLDEVRLYADALRPESIAAEHANLTDPSFVTFGNAETQ